MVSLKGNQVEIQPAVGGPTEMKHIKHVKYVLPADKYINKLQDYSRFGRKNNTQNKSQSNTGLTLETRQYIPYY